MAAAHIHPFQTEHFAILTGSIGFRIGREELVRGVGAKLVVPPGTPHRFWNAGDEEARFLCEVRPEKQEAFEQALADVPHALVGEVLSTEQLQIVGLPSPMPVSEPGDPHELTAPLVIDAELSRLKEAWQAPLRW